MWRPAARARRKRAVRSTSITACQSSSAVSAAGARRMMPALLTRMSRPPSAIHSAARRAPPALAGSARSATSGTARRPCARTRAQVASGEVAFPWRGHVRARLGQAGRDGGPQPARGARDQRRLAFERGEPHGRASFAGDGVHGHVLERQSLRLPPGGCPCARPENRLSRTTSPRTGERSRGRDPQGVVGAAHRHALHDHVADRGREGAAVSFLVEHVDLDCGASHLADLDVADEQVLQMPPRIELVLRRIAGRDRGCPSHSSANTLRMPPLISLPSTTPPWPSFIVQPRTTIFSLGTPIRRPSALRPDLIAMQSSPVSNVQFSISTSRHDSGLQPSLFGP